MGMTATPLKAVRAKCLECCCGNRAEVRRCHIGDCPLYPYRLGRNPRRAGIGGKPQLSESFPTSDFADASPGRVAR